MKAIKEKFLKNRKALSKAMQWNRDYHVIDRSDKFQVTWKPESADSFPVEITLIIIGENIWQYRYYNPKCHHNESWMSPEDFMEQMLEVLKLRGVE